jgi:predicted metal-dependent hydrolase
MKQLALPFLLEHDVTHLKNYFQKEVNKPVLLTFTDNATSMISVREKQSGISVRLHRIFLKADNEVLDEIVRFIKKKRGKTPVIKQFIRQNQSFLKERKPRTTTINPSGKLYNLTDIFNSLNSEYFNNSLSVVITWGRRSPRYAVKKRTLGNYQKKTNTIRINPILDNRKVPRYVIKYIVYHEMLHAVIDAVVKNGRRRIHSKEFKNRERKYRNYHQAIEWEKRNFRTYPIVQTLESII